LFNAADIQFGEGVEYFNRILFESVFLVRFSMNLAGFKKKIRIIMHAFCDEDDFNAQNLNAREIAYRLNPAVFDVTLFYKNFPDKRLVGKRNIRLVKPIPYYPMVFKYLLGKYDVFFYVRVFRADNIYFRLKKFFHDKKATVHIVENVVPYLASEHYNRIAKENALNSDYVYSVSKYVAETVEKSYGIETKIIPVGVDTTLFKPKNDRKEKQITVLYVGTFQHRKRPHLVIEAAKRFPKVKFHLIGKSGPLAPYLRSKAKALPNVQIDGAVPLPELVASMQSADVFLFPSIHEGFPKVTIEAAATGLPSIVFSNYKPETVLNGETGYIVRDVDEMMEKLQVLIEDADLRHRMGKRAREFAEKFDWNIIVKKWENEFINILKKGAD